MNFLVNAGLQTDVEHGLELELHTVVIHNVLDDTGKHRRFKNF